MLICEGCSAAVPAGRVRCPTCGAPLRRTAPTEAEGRTPRADRPSSGREREGPRFATGTVLASRYRIVTELGRGGMGEVYRAEDLKLNQAVALKFLPMVRAADIADLTHFRGEVRLARQISHPNVCRVFDLGEIDGHSFLCMEYIDGEDLAGLLRRIGRLSVDKAQEIARQLASGLAAIHDGGLLHRDLKPGNVMIDGRGRARITDFGLAVLASESSGGGSHAGTPYYMAPEQRARGEASVQSDLYSLGLVLYEMFTGRPALSGAGEAERPSRPSSFVEGIDPQTEAVLLQCLEPDPRRRPRSALQVSAALSGADPLAAALADGITLSPEAVAAAPRIGSLRPATATLLLLATISSLGAVLFLAGRVQAFRQVSFDHPPEVLRDRARRLLRDFGYDLPARDADSGFTVEPEGIRYLKSLEDRALPQAEVRDRLASGHPPLYEFWYRESPSPLPVTSDQQAQGAPRNVLGGAYVALDPAGHLDRLEVFRPRALPAASPAPEPSWPALLRAAGFDPARLTATAPQLVPTVYADRRAAWEGSLPAGPHQAALPIHIEAASLAGVPVWFRITGPWSHEGPLPTAEESGPKIQQIFLLIFHVTLLASALLLARRNLRLGRGDKRGAMRLAVFIFSMDVLWWLIGGKHELMSLQAEINEMIAFGLRTGFFFWMLYMGFEPYVRRLWPDRIISWNRLFTGRFRDPLVGRDVLLGCLLGLGEILARYAEHLITGRFEAGPVLGALRLGTLSGLPGLAQELIHNVTESLTASLEFMVLFLLLRIVLRRERLAVVAVWTLFTLGWTLVSPGPHLGLRIAFICLAAGLEILAWVRFGMLAGTVCYLTVILCHYPLTLDGSAWYSGVSLFAALVLVSLAGYGFATTVARQPWFARGGVLDG